MKFLLDPSPLRTLAIKYIAKYKIGTLERRIRLGAMPCAHYAYTLWNGAVLAKKLGHKGITAIEFGVAGGNGLLELERLAEIIGKELGVVIEVCGFDAMTGLPKSDDYRDIQFYWREGFFKMDWGKLRLKLKKQTRIEPGDVSETVKDFKLRYPIAAIMFDLDYYTSTRDALEIFNIPEESLLPRIFCYFDDIMGIEECPISNYTGARYAINEFNQNNEFKKIDDLHFLRTRKATHEKFHRVKVFHHFKHKDYNRFVGPDNQQQELT